MEWKAIKLKGLCHDDFTIDIPWSREGTSESLLAFVRRLNLRILAATVSVIERERERASSGLNLGSCETALVFTKPGHRLYYATNRWNL